MSETPPENTEKESAQQEGEYQGAIPVVQQSIVAEFIDFIKHNKAWWMTPILIVLLLMIAFIIFAENSPVLPFIYTVI